MPRQEGARRRPGQDQVAVVLAAIFGVLILTEMVVTGLRVRTL
ncbi:hypothetical protein ACRBEV_05490 [Methylobacterium phyllosphaerae]